MCLWSLDLNKCFSVNSWSSYASRKLSRIWESMFRLIPLWFDRWCKWRQYNNDDLIDVYGLPHSFLNLHLRAMHSYPDNPFCKTGPLAVYAGLSKRRLTCWHCLVTLGLLANKHRLCLTTNQPKHTDKLIDLKQKATASADIPPAGNFRTLPGLLNALCVKRNVVWTTCSVNNMPWHHQKWEMTTARQYNVAHKKKASTAGYSIAKSRILAWGKIKRTVEVMIDRVQIPKLKEFWAPNLLFSNFPARVLVVLLNAFLTHPDLSFVSRNLPRHLP